MAFENSEGEEGFNSLLILMDGLIKKINGCFCYLSALYFLAKISVADVAVNNTTRSVGNGNSGIILNVLSSAMLGICCADLSPSFTFFPSKGN